MKYFGRNIFYDEIAADDRFYLRNEEKQYFDQLDPRIRDYECCGIRCGYCYPKKNGKRDYEKGIEKKRAINKRNKKFRKRHFERKYEIRGK